MNAAPTCRPPRRNEPPPLWIGCDFSAWVRLLSRNGFAVHRERWRVTAAVTAASAVNTALRTVQEVVCRQRVAATPVRHAPVFVIGHWRTGTTLLHELLARDPRHAYPTTYDCFAPHHFLVTRSWLPGVLGRLMPDRRPMDNMAAGWDRPQEDEFALCLLGLPSPYERVAFPNRPGAGSLDPGSAPPGAARRWKAAYARLVRGLTAVGGGRRLVLKSPPHSCRIPTLLELFPDARFVHIVRDPYAVYPSTLNLWRLLYSSHALQRPTWAGLTERVLGDFERLYRAVDAGQKFVRPGRFHEVRYEDLVADPLGQLAALYRALDLGDFEPARLPVAAHVAGLAGYEPNRYALSPDERREVTRRWGDVIRRYGYPVRAD